MDWIHTFRIMMTLLDDGEVHTRAQRGHKLHAASHPTRSQEITVDVATSHFLFTIPPTATPSFRTTAVSFNWVLHFELMVGPQSDMTPRSSMGGTGQPALQQLLWSLPMVVFPPLR